MFRNLGASTSWNPKCLSRLVQGLLYLYLNIEPVVDERNVWSTGGMILTNGTPMFKDKT
jgi:hypothetical protein